MTTFLYSTTTNGASIGFDPDSDVLRIDTTDYSAADFTLTVTSDGSGVLFANGAKQFTLVGASFGVLSSSNVEFADGSMLLNATLDNSYATELVGTSHDDLLIGSTAQREIQLGASTADGEIADATSSAPQLSADGRFLVFTSRASNLTDGEYSNMEDVYVKDLLTGEVHRASETATGGMAVDNDAWGSHGGVVSADGRYVAFTSYANNLVANDANGWSDIFLKDVQTGKVTRVSTNSADQQASGGYSYNASISADGRYVAFTSGAKNLVGGDTNGAEDVFIKDLSTGIVTRVSTSSSGAQGNAGENWYGSHDAQISADGRFVVFASHSTNLVAGDDNGAVDIFVKNLATGEIVCASKDIHGDFAYYDAGSPAISADGRFVIFESSKDLLDDGHGGTYLRDMQTGELTRIPSGGMPQLSGDGRFVVFMAVDDLTEDDTNGFADVYVKDLVTGELARVSLGQGGSEPDAQSVMPSISLDGSTIAFRNDGSGLADGDPARSDVFVVGNPLYVRTLKGGAGNDSYVISNSSDRVVELAGQGTDTVQASVRYELTDNVEQLVLTGTQAINGIGNALNNKITGNSAANTLSGGIGADTMLGGGGDDTYYVDSSGDVVTESSNQGIDTIRSTVGVVLGANVENLVLSGSTNINGIGNSSVNNIAGNAGNNLLNGGLGVDTVNYAAAAAGVTIDLSLTSAQATGGAGTDTILGFENVTGSAYADTLTGTTGANTIDGGKGADTMTGGAGNDSYFVDSTSDRIVELVDGGIDSVQSSASFTLAADIENLTLTGTGAINGTGNSLANVIIGNAGANSLSGGAGNDTLNAGVGADTITGGSGSDTYVVDNVGDMLFEQAGGGLDLVQSSVSFSLEPELENLTLTGTLTINATGNAKANVLIGNTAANVINGGTGADTMTGGSGSDTYVVDDARDQTIEQASGGLDLVQASVSWTLGAELENMTLTGSAAINATGNERANAILGNAAANVINGGVGADSMTGGSGSDTYVVDSAGDHVVEQSGGGLDQVQASISFTLGDEVENLTLTGTAAINATGNYKANALVGNGAANVLDGGYGADTMTGGSGSDTYVVDHGGDRVIEQVGGGLDLVLSSISYTLGSEVENLTLTGWASEATGNTKANVLTGNEFDNVLNGGAGADTLRGGDGNDTYVVDQAGDLVVEGIDDWSGIDTVQSAVSWALGSNVERLVLTGSANNNATGNAGDNSLTGNSGNNIIDGGMGGADGLRGNAGSDTFVLHDLQGDVVFDFQRGVDKLKIDQSDLRIGDGDTVVEGAVSIIGPNGFANSAELVIVVSNITGSIDESSAAAFIGHANSTYAIGDKRLFVVDNGTDTAVYRFESANADSIVSADELTLMATLQGTWTEVNDFVFGA